MALRNGPWMPNNCGVGWGSEIDSEMLYSFEYKALNPLAISFGFVSLCPLAFRRNGILFCAALRLYCWARSFPALFPWGYQVKRR